MTLKKSSAENLRQVRRAHHRNGDHSASLGQYKSDSTSISRRFNVYPCANGELARCVLSALLQLVYRVRNACQFATSRPEQLTGVLTD